MFYFEAKKNIVAYLCHGAIEIELYFSHACGIFNGDVFGSTLGDCKVIWIKN